MGVVWELELGKLLKGEGRFWKVAYGWTFLLISLNPMAWEESADL